MKAEINAHKAGLLNACKLPRFATTGKVLFTLLELSDQDNIVRIPQSKLAKLLELSAVAVNRAIRTLKEEDFIRQDDYYGWMLNPNYFFHGTAKSGKTLTAVYETLPRHKA